MNGHSADKFYAVCFTHSVVSNALSKRMMENEHLHAFFTFDTRAIIHVYIISCRHIIHDTVSIAAKTAK